MSGGATLLKTAFADWENRIAPVFDSAHHVHVVEAESCQIVNECDEVLPEGLPLQRILRLVSMGIGTLVCGAISRPVFDLLAAYGIRVVPFVAGDLREVIQAWVSGTLARNEFAMPGCRGRGVWGIDETHEIHQKVDNMNGRGRRMGGGGGQGRGGRRAGGANTSMSTRVTGNCLCPQCGEKVPHERGEPCASRKCPKCGTAMKSQ
jgi:predicted Fe-Mo cluster-binding NifX family protein